MAVTSINIINNNSSAGNANDPCYNKQNLCPPSAAPERKKSSNGNVREEEEGGNGKQRQRKQSARLMPHSLMAKRVKDAKIGRPSFLILDDYQHKLNYASSRPNRLFPLFGCANMRRRPMKEVPISELLEIRQGYRTDAWHRAARVPKFQEAAPEDCCFSIIFKHPRFVCKSLDFVVTEKQKEDAVQWMNQLREMVSKINSKSSISFDEKVWILQNFRQADLDRSHEIEFEELWRLLKRLNLQLSEQYVRTLFNQVISKNGKSRDALSENEFLDLFSVLTDIPEYKNVLRLASGDGGEQLNAEALQKFLKEEQGFSDIDPKMAETIIEFCEPVNTAAVAGEKAKAKSNSESQKPRTMGINGFRRLLQSRWGNILRDGHESVFMDMDRPLQSYFINSSHNTYLTGYQVHGSATVEGYILALRKGSRLLELDIFDGDHGEPQITHKRTFIVPISLRNVLKCIKNYAFAHNPYPVILTIENHVSVLQQRVMADIFREILGDHLYLPPDNASTHPLPSPNQLKKKILLRGKTSQVLATVVPAIASNLPVDDGSPEDPENAESEDRHYPRPPIDALFGRLIALPSVKLTPDNIYKDIKEHPANGSPSLSEGKVQTYLDSNVPLPAYTATRIVKSYPSGLRQDSSNLNPMESWVCGIQSAALNFQTCDDVLDVNNGFFSINGRTGYVLKPDFLLEGLDPRHKTRTPWVLRISIICGQYLPKVEPGNSGIVDPYVSVETYGIPRDMYKVRTRAIHNNGFNPVWNENFFFPLYCPELAVLRLCVKDFDSSSSDEFIGEFSVPVRSIRQGYSHIRLNTGVHHAPDEAAAIFVRIGYPCPLD